MAQARPFQKKRTECNCERVVFLSNPFFLRILFSFFALSTPPFPRQFRSPKSCLSGTSDLFFLVEHRQLPGAGFWGRFWTGRPTGKRGKIIFLARGKRRANVGVVPTLLQRAAAREGYGGWESSMRTFRGSSGLCGPNWGLFLS